MTGRATVPFCFFRLAFYQISAVAPAAPKQTVRFRPGPVGTLCVHIGLSKRRPRSRKWVFIHVQREKLPGTPIGRGKDYITGDRLPSTLIAVPVT